MEGALRALYKAARQHRDKASGLLEQLGEEPEAAEDDAKLDAARALEAAVLALSTCALVHPPLRPSYLETTYLHPKPGRCKDPTCSQQGTCPGNVFTTKPTLEAADGDYGEMGLVIRHHKGNTAHARPKPYEYNLSADRAAARIYSAWATWGHAVLQDDRVARSSKADLKPTPKFFTHNGGRPFMGDSTAEKWRKALGLHGITINGRPINLRDVRSLFVCGLALKHASQNTYIQDDELDTLAAGMGSSPTVLLNEYNKLYSMERERSGVRAAHKASTLAAHYVEDDPQQLPVGDQHQAAQQQQEHPQAPHTALGQDGGGAALAAMHPGGAADLPSPPPPPTQLAAPARPELTRQVTPQGRDPAARQGEHVSQRPRSAAGTPAPSPSARPRVVAVGPTTQQQQMPPGRTPAARAAGQASGHPWATASGPLCSSPLAAAVGAVPQRREAPRQELAVRGAGRAAGSLWVPSERPFSPPLPPIPASAVQPLRQRETSLQGRRPIVHGAECAAAAVVPSGGGAPLAPGRPPTSPLPLSQLLQLRPAGGDYPSLSHAEDYPAPAAWVQGDKGAKKRQPEGRGTPQEPSRRLQARFAEIDRRFSRYYGQGAYE
jgi:hypothetical protein